MDTFLTAICPVRRRKIRSANAADEKAGELPLSESAPHMSCVTAHPALRICAIWTENRRSTALQMLLSN